jgi:hypothetical protein
MVRGGWGAECGDRVGEVEVAGCFGGVKGGVGGVRGRGRGESHQIFSRFLSIKYV